MERSVHSHNADAAGIDPVCGMKVAIADATPQLVVAGQAVFFCGDGCRDRYATQHADSDAGSAPAR